MFSRQCSRSKNNAEVESQAVMDIRVLVFSMIFVFNEFKSAQIPGSITEIFCFCLTIKSFFNYTEISTRRSGTVLTMHVLEWNCRPKDKKLL